MKFTNRYVWFVFAIVAFISGITVFSARTGAQDEGWRIIRADYGYRTQRADVTSLLIDLITRGGENGKIYVNDPAMGGDPAQGHEKTLHVVARNRRNEEREFEFKQHSYLDVQMFDVREARHDDRDDRPPRTGDRDDDANRLKIIRAFYGVQGRTVNVADLLRDRARDGRIRFVVSNESLGVDPAPGMEKVLIVVYSYQGNETATAVREGNTLTIP